MTHDRQLQKPRTFWVSRRAMLPDLDGLVLTARGYEKAKVMFVLG
jgi:hypothetical protein